MRKLPDQVVRLTIIFAIGITALIMVRQRFVPESFGEIGHYRADAIGAVASQGIRYAGWQACVACHPEEAEQKQGSYHRVLSCETCHGAAYAHTEDPSEELPLVPRKRGACLYCHSYLPSRPTGFPQIIELQHNPMEPCINCHDPHDPTPPEVPGACSGCHGQIARTKAISHHRSLECETCHETMPEHREAPRSYMPKKPREREFCGRCHSESAEVTREIWGIDLGSYEIPRIDVDTHGNTYQCWQCHYPHFPEGR
jgi:hypothetical protein